jgi:hypothetical protein
MDGRLTGLIYEAELIIAFEIMIPVFVCFIKDEPAPISFIPLMSFPCCVGSAARRYVYLWLSHVSEVQVQAGLLATNCCC